MRRGIISPKYTMHPVCIMIAWTIQYGYQTLDKFHNVSVIGVWNLVLEILLCSRIYPSLKVPQFLQTTVE